MTDRPEEPEAARPEKRPRKRLAEPPADLAALAGGWRLAGEFKPRESRPEQISRLKLAEELAAHERAERRAEAEHGRRRETIILAAVVGVVSSASLMCMWITLRPGYAPETVKWATSVLTAIVSGGLGVLVGGKIAKQD
jgi:hypothetical protein